MINQEQITQVQDFLNPAQSIIVIVGANASLDMVSAASGFFSALQASGKDVIFASPELPTADPNLSGIDQIKTSLGHRNLSISFDYQETAVDKVSYHIGEQTNKFFLTIKPQKGHQPLDSSTVEFSYTGAEADLIFMFGVHSFESLEQLYYANEQFFADTTVININTFETEIGNIKLNTSGDISISCAMARVLRDLGFTISSDAATNFLIGIEEVTNSFGSFSTTPETFETVAWLMRQGARRVKRASLASAGGSPSKVVQSKVSTEIKPSESRRELQVIKSAQPQNKSADLASVMQRTSSEANKTQVKEVKSQKKANKKSNKAGGLDHQPGMMIASK